MSDKGSRQNEEMIYGYGYSSRQEKSEINSAIDEQQSTYDRTRATDNLELSNDAIQGELSAFRGNKVAAITGHLSLQQYLAVDEWWNL